MKKYLLLLLVLIPFISKAQGPAFSGVGGPEFFNVVFGIIALSIIVSFITKLIKMIFENRLKHKIIDKGISDTVAASILNPTEKEEGNTSIKWFCLLAAIGIGLTAIHYSVPLGIHSLAIMSFSISAGFLGYYYFTKQTSLKNKP